MGTWVEYFIDIMKCHIDFCHIIASYTLAKRWNSNLMKGNTKKNLHRIFGALWSAQAGTPLLRSPQFQVGLLQVAHFWEKLWACWRHLVIFAPIFFSDSTFLFALKLGQFAAWAFVPKISRPSSFSTVVAVKFFDRRLCGLFLEIPQPLHVQLMLFGFLWGHIGLLGSSRFHEWRHCSTWRFLVTYHARGWGKVISGHPTVGCHHPSQPSWLWRTPRIKETLWCGEMCWVPPSHHPSRGVDMSKSLQLLDFRHLLQLRQSGSIVIVYWLAPSKRDQTMYSVKSNAVRMVSFRVLGGKTRPPRGTSWVDRTCYCFQSTHGQKCVVFVAKKVISCCIFDQTTPVSKSVGGAWTQPQLFHFLWFLYAYTYKMLVCAASFETCVNNSGAVFHTINCSLQSQWS